MRGRAPSRPTRTRHPVTLIDSDSKSKALKTDMRLFSGLIVTAITVSRKDKSNYLMPPLTNHTYAEGVKLLERYIDCSYDHETKENASTYDYMARVVVVGQPI